jgi:hypothetical protein
MGDFDYTAGRPSLCPGCFIEAKMRDLSMPAGCPYTAEALQQRRGNIQSFLQGADCFILIGAS